MRRMISDKAQKYIKELSNSHPDPTAEWGGSGSEYMPGTGIDITNNEISAKIKAGSGIVVDTDLTDDSLVVMVDQADIPYKSDLATVATTGDYDDLTNKPTIPDAVSGTNDGTNWTSLTIGSTTKAIPAGGSGGSYTFTNGLTENSGTVSWDLNNLIKQEDDGLILSYQDDENAFRPHSYSLVFGNVNDYSQWNPSYIEAGTASPITGAGGSIAFGSIAAGIIGNGIIKAGNKGSCAFGMISTSNQTIQAGNASLAFGYNDNKALGDGSCAHGTGTNASSNYQTAIGQFNTIDSNNTYAFIIGNGTADNARSNAMTVGWDGTIVSKNLPAVNTATAGLYNLKATVDSQGGVTYNWSAGGGAPSNMVTTDTEQMITANKEFDYGVSLNFGDYQAQLDPYTIISDTIISNTNGAQNASLSAGMIGTRNNNTNHGIQIWPDEIIYSKDGFVNNDNISFDDLVALINYAKAQGWIQ